MDNSKGFDLDATVGWVMGVLKDPQGTAAAFKATQPTWQRAFLQIALPVYVASAIVGFVLSLLFGRPFMFGGVAGAPFLFLLSVLWSLALLFVVAFVFDFFAGMFEGQRSYDGAFSCLSLAIVPASVGGAFGPFPFLGWLVSLVASIYALVLMYRFIPLFLGVPEAKRAVHFIVSLLVAGLLWLVIGGVLALVWSPLLGSSPAVVEESNGGGSWLFGGIERQASIAEQAANDRYQPPADGRLTDDQVAAFARALERTRELRERLGARFEEMDDEDGPSFGQVFSGVGDAVRLSTAEMEVVKTAGGNWAEHQWVRGQLETARIQRDSSPAVEHNYGLFQRYQEQIEAYE